MNASPSLTFSSAIRQPTNGRTVPTRRTKHSAALAESSGLHRLFIIPPSEELRFEISVFEHPQGLSFRPAGRTLRAPPSSFQLCYSLTLLLRCAALSFLMSAGVS